MTSATFVPLVNRLTPRDAYLRQMCLPLSKNSSNLLKDYTNLKLFVFIASVCIAEIPILLPKIPLLPCLADSTLVKQKIFRH